MVLWWRAVTEVEPWRPSLDGSFNRIIEQDCSFLEKIFLEEKILEILMCCKGDKAPESDHLNISFFQEDWGTQRNNIVTFFMSFIKLDPSWGALIPLAGVVSIKDFRSINLAVGVCRIIAKVVTRRLARVVVKMVGEC